MLVQISKHYPYPQGIGQQNSVFVHPGNFTDFPGVDAIVGTGDDSNTIVANHAKHVDGGGGGDVIFLLKNDQDVGTVVDAYPGDKVLLLV